MSDLDILQKDMPQSYRRLKSMVKRFLDPKSKAFNFDARNERTVTGHRRKGMAKGSPSGLSENREKCYQRNAKGKCTRRDACSFRFDSHKLGASSRSSSPAPRSQTNSDGESSSNGRPPRGSSPSGERRARVIHAILLSKLQITVRLHVWRKVFLLTR